MVKTPKLIHRTDYRSYQMPMQFPSTYFKQYYVEQSSAVERYFNARPDIQYKELRRSSGRIEYRIWQFARLDDSKMFCLALSQYIDTQGVHFD
jgi:hypothetical protein